MIHSMIQNMSLLCDSESHKPASLRDPDDEPVTPILPHQGVTVRVTCHRRTCSLLEHRELARPSVEATVIEGLFRDSPARDARAIVSDARGVEHALREVAKHLGGAARQAGGR